MSNGQSLRGSINSTGSLKGSTNVGNILKGDRGDPGVTFTPAIDENGNLSWTNDGGLTNPETVNITGPVGPKGKDGKSAYEYAQEAGYTGTEEEFADKLASDKGVASWNDLTDKPFGEETVMSSSDTVMWDGNKDGRYFIDLSDLFEIEAYFVKVHDCVPTIGDCKDGILVYVLDNGETITNSYDAYELKEYFFDDGYANIPPICIVPYDNYVTSDGVSFAEKGVYCTYIVALESRGVGLTIPGYAGFVTAETAIRTVDEKYIPDSIARVKDIPEITNGKDGAPGKDGTDGFSPTAKVEQTDTGARITITDKDGTTTADVLNGKDGANGEGGAGAAIIDVVELPTENINEQAFYRLTTAKCICNETVIDEYTMHCVNGLPETGELVTNADMTKLLGYYNVADNEVYGYLDDMLGTAFGVGAGWYPFGMLAQAADMSWRGVITCVEDDPHDDALRLLVSYEYHTYKNEWVKHIFAYEKAPKFDVSWDGDMTDKTVIDMSLLGYDAGTYFVKVSDEVLTTNDVIGGRLSRIYDDNSRGSDAILDEYIDETTYNGAYTIDNYVIVVQDEVRLTESLGVPSGLITNGVYFYYDESYCRVCSMTTHTRKTKIRDEYLDLEAYVNHNDVERMIADAIGNAIGGSY